ncbi:MAG: hypothetical protein PHI99_06280 [Syntrophales bacterium]|nr:hypothetical protein [Syntrophales bacterium]
MFLGELFFYEIPEKDILFLAMVRPVRVRPDEVYRGIDKQRIDLVLFRYLLGCALKEAQHLFNQPMFPHQGAYWLHDDTSFYRVVFINLTIGAAYQGCCLVFQQRCKISTVHV